MSVLTKKRRIKRKIQIAKPRSKTLRFKQKKEKLTPWRGVFKEQIAKRSEGGLMLLGSRHKEGITQKKLAESLGISQHHISEMENGKRPIGKEMAKRLAEFFKTDYRLFL